MTLPIKFISNLVKKVVLLGASFKSMKDGSLVMKMRLGNETKICEKEREIIFENEHPLEFEEERLQEATTGVDVAKNKDTSTVWHSNLLRKSFTYVDVIWEKYVYISLVKQIVQLNLCKNQHEAPEE